MIRNGYVHILCSCFMCLWLGMLLLHDFYVISLFVFVGFCFYKIGVMLGIIFLLDGYNKSLYICLRLSAYLIVTRLTKLNGWSSRKSEGLSRKKLYIVSALFSCLTLTSRLTKSSSRKPKLILMW